MEPRGTTREPHCFYASGVRETSMCQHLGIVGTTLTHRHDLFSLVAQSPPFPQMQCWNQFVRRRFFFKVSVLVTTLHKGGGLETSWWTGENKSFKNERSRFWQKCWWWWRVQSFNHKATPWRLFLCFLSACRATLAEIFFRIWSVCVCSKSVRLEEPIKRMASPRVEAVQDSIQGHVG